MARPLRVPSVLSLLSAILVASPARADLRPGDIVVNEPTFYGEVLKLDPVTRAVRHVTAGGYLPSYQVHMALEAGGNLVVVAENKIVRVNPTTGAQTLVSSGGSLRVSGGIAVAADGGLIVGNFGSGPSVPPSIIRVDPSTGAPTPITSGGLLLYPYSLHLDTQGDILVTSGSSPGSILRVDPSSGIQTIAFAGGLIESPVDFVFDSSGALYIVDSGPGANNCPTVACGRIVRVDPGTGEQTLVSSGNQLVNPHAIAIASDGSLLVTNYYAFNEDPNTSGARLIRIDPVTGAQTVFSSRLASVADVLVVPGILLPPLPVCGDDQVNQTHEQCDGSAKGVCPGGCNADCTCFEGLRPRDAVLLDTFYQGVFRIDRATGDRTVLSSKEIGEGPLWRAPVGLGIERDGKILVTDSFLATLFEVDPITGDRRIVASDPPHGYPFLSTTFRALDVALGTAGEIFVAESAYASLQRVDPVTGSRSLISYSGLGTGFSFNYPSSVVTEPDGKLLVTESLWGVLRIDPVTGNRIFASSSIYPYTTGTGQAFRSPQTLGLDPPAGFLVADTGDRLGRNSMVLSVDRATGNRTLISGCSISYPPPCPIVGAGPNFFYPRGVAREPEGSILVGDLYLDTLFRVDATTGDRTIISSSTIGKGPELLGVVDLELVPANLDSDDDGFSDDGDGSGTVGDHACSPGQTAGCDDNCRLIANPGQNDFDADGQGDVCDADDDNDGLADAVETNTGVFLSASDTGTSPLNADSDGDGFTDGAEVAAGSDPNDPGSLPQGGPIPTLGTTGAFVFALALLLAGGRALRRDPAARSGRERA